MYVNTQFTQINRNSHFSIVEKLQQKDQRKTEQSWRWWQQIAKREVLSFSFNNCTRICPIHSSPVHDIYQLENRFASTGPAQVWADMLRLLPAIFQVLLTDKSTFTEKPRRARKIKTILARRVWREIQSYPCESFRLLMEFVLFSFSSVIPQSPLCELRIPKF